jgi:hypothetical protein
MNQVTRRDFLAGAAGAAAVSSLAGGAPPPRASTWTPASAGFGPLGVLTARRLGLPAPDARADAAASLRTP